MSHRVRSPDSNRSSSDSAHHDDSDQGVYRNLTGLHETRVLKERIKSARQSQKDAATRLTELPPHRRPSASSAASSSRRASSRPSSGAASSRNSSAASGAELRLLRARRTTPGGDAPREQLFDPSAADSRSKSPDSWTDIRSTRGGGRDSTEQGRGPHGTLTPTRNPKLTPKPFPTAGRDEVRPESTETIGTGTTTEFYGINKKPIKDDSEELQEYDPDEVEVDYGPEKTGQDYGEWYDSEKEEQPTAPAQQHEIDTDFVAGPIPLVLQPAAKTGSGNALSFKGMPLPPSLCISL